MYVYVYVYIYVMDLCTYVVEGDQRKRDRKHPVSRYCPRTHACTTTHPPSTHTPHTHTNFSSVYLFFYSTCSSHLPLMYTPIMYII